jgi:hypothetical protein
MARHDAGPLYFKNPANLMCLFLYYEKTISRNPL